MSIHAMQLPLGWYPGSEEEIRRQLDEWKSQWKEEKRAPSQPGCAGIVPHAGWHFSGSLAFEVMGRLNPEADTVIVAGGHLGASSSLFCIMDDAYETPLGPLPLDGELRDLLAGEMVLREDNFVDNTVEVHLPMVKYLWPEASLLALRIPPSEGGCDTGKFLAEACGRLGRRACFIGSTDLTHYGPSYNFMPRGTGHQAIHWVQQENDGAILNAMTAMDRPEVLRLGQESQAACSSGAAAAAMAFAEQMGVNEGVLLDYRTSLEKHPSDSFVGYGGVIF